MKQRLFLTSAGIVKEIRKEFLQLLGKDPKKSVVYFIATAADPQKDRGFVEADRKKLRKIGLIIKELDLKRENKNTLYKKLSACDVIYIGGGNTFYLLNWIRKSGFNEIIYDLLNKGKTYVGASAGSYIVCPTIEQATWKHQDRNRWGVKDLKALNLVPFLISAHFEEKYRHIIEKAVKTAKYPIIALNDNQVVLVEGEKWRIAGKGKKVTFNFDKTP
ncbi:Type 1 glutamine amidotransferase-like domain-containing protein [Candidatus Roizmanbacteria bacterium]|nr:Type 1 glutamine amidotransferase-like domain-containing protein [Candidatus Roizmanbacteria bacterium]